MQTFRQTASLGGVLLGSGVGFSTSASEEEGDVSGAFRVPKPKTQNPKTPKP